MYEEAIKMRNVYIIGKGQTKRGYFPERDIRSLAAEATFKALDDAELSIKDIGQAWLSHYPSTADMQMTAGQVIIDAIGAPPEMGCIHIEEACTSGGQAMHDACLAVASGRYETALVIGIGKHQDSFDYLNSFADSGFNPFTDKLGIRLFVVGANLEYNQKYGVTQEDYASFFEMQYWYAVKNPISLIYKQKPRTKKDYYKLPYRFYPDRVGITPTGCDGASAIIFASKDQAKHKDSLVSVAAISHKEES